MYEPQIDTLAIVSLSCGVLGWMISCCAGMLFPMLGVVGIPIGLVGMILGILSVRRIGAEPEQLTGKPLAIAGILLNLALLVVMVVGVILATLGIGFLLLSSEL